MRGERIVIAVSVLYREATFFGEVWKHPQIVQFDVSPSLIDRLHISITILKWKL